MDIHLLSKSYAVRKLTEADVEIIFALMRENTIYFDYHPPFVTRESILDDMTALPPKKSYEDKYYIGFFKGASLIAVMDLILSYPNAETAFIGFFMTDVHHQNRGTGSGIICEICAYLKSLGYKNVQLGVDKGNPQSYAFWTKNQFCVRSENTYILMERTL